MVFNVDFWGRFHIYKYYQGGIARAQVRKFSGTNTGEDVIYKFQHSVIATNTTLK